MPPGDTTTMWPIKATTVSFTKKAKLFWAQSDQTIACLRYTHDTEEPKLADRPTKYSSIMLSIVIVICP